MEVSREIAFSHVFVKLEVKLCLKMVLRFLKYLSHITLNMKMCVI